MPISPSEQSSDEIWETFWVPIFERAKEETLERGERVEWVTIDKPTLDQIKLELSDYRIQMHEVNLAYCDVTGGYISKPNTAARHVIDRVDERMEEAWKDGQREVVEFLLEKDQEGHFASFTAGDLADLIMVHFGITGNPNIDDNRGDSKTG